MTINEITVDECLSEVPRRLRDYRRERGLSMRELAERCGTSQQQIDRLEKGHRRITLEWLLKISLALECQLQQLIPEIEADSQNMLSSLSYSHQHINGESAGQKEANL